MLTFSQPDKYDLSKLSYWKNEVPVPTGNINCQLTKILFMSTSISYWLFRTSPSDLSEFLSGGSCATGCSDPGHHTATSSSKYSSKGHGQFIWKEHQSLGKARIGDVRIFFMRL
jgi:hypothetical protein